MLEVVAACCRRIVLASRTTTVFYSPRNLGTHVAPVLPGGRVESKVIKDTQLGIIEGGGKKNE